MRENRSLLKYSLCDFQLLVLLASILCLLSLDVSAESFEPNQESYKGNENHRNFDVFIKDGSAVTSQENVDSGLLTKILEFSTDIYYLWDSNASSIVGAKGETRHVRVRIEEDQLEKVQNKLGGIHANGNSLTPKAEISRGFIEIYWDEDKSIKLYPYAENAETLVAAFERMFYGHSVGITKQGMVYIIGETSITYGYLDYYIIKPGEFVFQKFSFSEIYKENGFDTIMITYPSGVKQKMYFYKVGISTL